MNKLKSVDILAEGKSLKKEKPFWESKPLGKMSDKEWESLCDGCGRCCLNKVEYTDTKEIHYTSAACKLLNVKTCRCKDYSSRQKLVPDCLQLSPRNIKKLKYMPDTCAYRLLATGKSLPSWHPLISQDPKSVHEAGISVRGKATSEDKLTGDLEDHIIDWVKPCRK